jgi:hypothetical protein
MPLYREELEAKGRHYTQSQIKSAETIRAEGAQTAFLCHSHDDEVLVKGLLKLFQEIGWSVYVDWGDPSLPAAPTRATAVEIQSRIKAQNLFMFLATPNSLASRWCPWEIGYADGVKAHKNILIIPTTDRSGKYSGNEYLQLYRRVLYDVNDELRIFDPGKDSSAEVLKRL